MQYLYREELCIFYRAHFGSLGRVANVSLEGDVFKQADFPVNFGGLSCSRAEDIALPSFLASMNSVGELVETILSEINIADTNDSTNGCGVLERGAVVVLPCRMTLVIRKLGNFLLLRGIGKTCCVWQIRSLPRCKTVVTPNLEKSSFMNHKIAQLILCLFVVESYF